MTERRFPIWSRVAFAILLPIAAYSAWDYIETKRLDARLSVIRQTGELATQAEQWRPAANDEADRYYRAASALASFPFAGLQVDVRTPTWKALRESRWTPDVIEIFRAAISANREALEFVDRAAKLPFSGFMPGTSYNYRIGDLMKLATLCEVRAAVSASEGDGEAAVASFASEARIVRALDLAASPVGSLAPKFFGLSTAMEKTKPSAAARETAARAFADIDRDDRLRYSLLQYRAELLSGPVYRFVAATRGSVPRPLSTHTFVNALDGFDRLLAAAGQPWPQRIDAMNAVGVWPVWSDPIPQRILASFTKVTAEQIKRIRCARLLLSTAPLALTDPLTGKPLDASTCRL